MIRENLERVRERIARAAGRAGRDPAEITIVAVSKTVAAERVEEAIRAGVTVLGENRVQEAKEKIPRVGLPAEWHLVGHLQSNKAKIAATLFHTVHSVDSVELARVLDRAGAPLEVLIQVNLSGEASKSGIAPEALRAVLEGIGPLEHLQVRGLMTIPPAGPVPETARPLFARLRRLAEGARAWGLPRVNMDALSMGMSDDFEVAIEEGATLVRIGRALFGERLVSEN